MSDDGIPAGGARDVLLAVRDALNVPNGATTGDQETRDKILVERAGHAVVMLNAILDDGHPVPDVPWLVEYLRAQLAKHPAEGYKTWAERAAELERDKAGGR